MRGLKRDPSSRFFSRAGSGSPPPPPAVCSGIPGTGLGPKAERVPLLPKGLWHTGVTQPRHFGGSGCERGGGRTHTEGSPDAALLHLRPKTDPGPSGVKPGPEAGSTPGLRGSVLRVLGLPRRCRCPPGSCEGRDGAAVRLGPVRRGRGPNGLCWKKNPCFPGTF